jgi:hypothetical protein
MTLESVYFVTQIIAALAVVASLLYVGVQLKQNTQAIRAAAVQSMAATVATNATNVAANPQNASLFRRGLTDFAELTEAEREQFVQLMNGIFLSQDSIFWLYSRGSFPEELWQRELGGLCAWLGTSGGKSAWEQAHLSSPFRQHVDENIDRLSGGRNWRTTETPQSARSPLPSR